MSEADVVKVLDFGLAKEIAAKDTDLTTNQGVIGTPVYISPERLQGEDGLEALSCLLKTYFHLGGQHLQLNILDSEVLKRAQRHPEEYRTLSVRVVGYSAYFVTLTQEAQDDIIRRTEHAL